MKVLWFSNVGFTNEPMHSTGTWLISMANELLKADRIELFNISQGDTDIYKKKSIGQITQWLVPFEKLTKNGLPSSKTIKFIQDIVDVLRPDIIHIWGTENYWGLLAARGLINGNVIIEIQGLKSVCYKYFYTNLTFWDIANCFGLREIIKPRNSIVSQRKSFMKWGKFETEIILCNNNISVQSQWVYAYIKSINPQANILYTSIKLRDEFISAEKWERNKCFNYQIFTSCSSVLSYKGLHILVDSLAILKKKFPTVQLVIAGYVVKDGIRQDGYTRWLKKKICMLGLENNVLWTGSLNAQGLVVQLQNAHVVVIPSLVETYCVALDESLSVGAPTVVSFSGAMPELAENNETAIFFPPGDSVMCASAIERIFDNDYIGESISEQAYEKNKLKQNKDFKNIQLGIYHKIISKQSHYKLSQFIP